MRSQRTIRLDRDAKKRINEAFDDFSSGMNRRFGLQPEDDRDCGTSIKQAFTSMYPVLEWCRTVKNVGKARFFLREIRSSTPMAIAFCSLGIYETARLQLRYSLECFLSFIYFRDHPRELELALLGKDVWDQTRPKAVTGLMRKLPEYDSRIGIALIDLLNSTYRDLCQYAHPRTPARMAHRQYIASAKTSSSNAKGFQDVVKRFAHVCCGVLMLCSETEFAVAPEITRHILTRAIPADWRRRIERELRDRSN